MPTTKLVSIKTLSREIVYDLEIKDNHNFFANSINVHNCYQEQYMRIAAKIGGQTKAETNAFRRAISKKAKSAPEEEKRHKKIDSYFEKFMKNATLPENIGNVDDARKIWDLIVSFAAYGFNASHSVSYTYISFREYWLKHHYDAEFNIALLNNTPRGKKKKNENVIALYILNIMKKGYKVNLPMVNYSEELFSLKTEKEIVWGISWIKGMSGDAIAKIVEDRNTNGQYTSLDQFYGRLTGKVINKRVIDGLIWSGALDEFITNPSDLFIETTNVSVTNIRDRFDLHEYIYVNLRKEKKYKKLKKSLKEIIAKEEEIVGISLTEMLTFERARQELELAGGEGVVTLSDIDKSEEKKAYLTVSRVDNVVKAMTKTKKEYRKAYLRDDTGHLMSFVWPWKCKNWEGVKKGDLLAIKIEVENGFVNMMRFSKISEDDEDE